MKTVTISVSFPIPGADTDPGAIFWNHNPAPNVIALEIKYLLEQEQYGLAEYDTVTVNDVVISEASLDETPDL